MDVPANLQLNTTKIPPKSTEIPPKSTEILPKVINIILNNKNLECKHCQKIFSRIDAKNRHEKSRCKNKKENNELILRENSEIVLLKKEISKIKHKLKNRNKIINNTNNNTNNIIINNFGNFAQKYDSITDEKIHEFMKNPYKSLQKLFVLKHFNKNDPQNQNIKINNLCGKYATVYLDGEWIATVKKDVIETTLDDNYTEVSCYWWANQDNNYVNKKFSILRNIYDNEENKVDKNELFHDTNRVIFNETQKLKRNKIKNKA